MENSRFYPVLAKIRINRGLLYIKSQLYVSVSSIIYID